MSFSPVPVVTVVEVSSEQIRYKQKQVEDNLRRIGKIELPEISPILGSDKTEFYRNKLEFTFSNKRWLTNEEVHQDVKYDQMNAVGFHIPGAYLCFSSMIMY